MPTQFLGTLENKNYLADAIQGAAQSFNQNYMAYRQMAIEDKDRQNKIDEQIANMFTNAPPELREKLASNPKFQESLQRLRDNPVYGGLVAEDQDGKLSMSAPEDIWKIDKILPNGTIIKTNQWGQTDYSTFDPRLVDDSTSFTGQVFYKPDKDGNMVQWAQVQRRNKSTGQLEFDAIPVTSGAEGAGVVSKEQYESSLRVEEGKKVSDYQTENQGKLMDKQYAQDLKVRAVEHSYRQQEAKFASDLDLQTKMTFAEYQNKLDIEATKIVDEFRNKLNTDSTLMLDDARQTRELQKLAKEHGYRLEEIWAQVKGELEIAQYNGQFRKGANPKDPQTPGQAYAKLVQTMDKQLSDPKHMAAPSEVFGTMVGMAKEYWPSDPVSPVRQMFIERGLIDPNNPNDKLAKELASRYGNMTNPTSQGKGKGAPAKPTQMQDTINYISRLVLGGVMGKTAPVKYESIKDSPWSYDREKIDATFKRMKWDAKYRDKVKKSNPTMYRDYLTWVNKRQSSEVISKAKKK